MSKRKNKHKITITENGMLIEVVTPKSRFGHEVAFGQASCQDSKGERDRKIRRREKLRGWE